MQHSYSPGAVRRNRYRTLQTTAHQDRLVAIGCGISISRHQGPRATGLTSISAHSNTWVKAALLQLFNKPDNHGGFAGASRGDITYNNHWYMPITAGASPLLLYHFGSAR
jgi:hypothetical protein